MTEPFTRKCALDMQSFRHFNKMDYTTHHHQWLTIDQQCVFVSL